MAPTHRTEIEVEVTLEGRVDVFPAYPGEVLDPPRDIEAAGDALMEALIDMGVVDPIVVSNGTTGHLAVTIIVSADSLDRGVTIARDRLDVALVRVFGPRAEVPEPTTQIDASADDPTPVEQHLELVRVEGILVDA